MQGEKVPLENQTGGANPQGMGMESNEEEEKPAPTAKERQVIQRLTGKCEKLGLQGVKGCEEKAAHCRKFLGLVERWAEEKQKGKDTCPLCGLQYELLKNHGGLGPCRKARAMGGAYPAEYIKGAKQGEGDPPRELRA